MGPTSGKELGRVSDAAVNGIKTCGTVEISDVERVCSGSVARERVFLTMHHWARAGAMHVVGGHIMVPADCLMSDSGVD